MTGNELKQKYIEFFKNHGHVQIPSAPLVPENDPTTLFNSAGMQPLIPYLLGQPHPEGKRLVDVQKCIRTDDIDEVGDTYHHTFFEMLGNWSLGDYFKEESINLSFKFLKDSLKLDMDKIWVSVFAGDQDAPRDEEAAKIWQEVGIPQDRIVYLGKKDNWWAAGPLGPCGPDTEIFYDTTQTPHGKNCQPGDNCGRFVEIWNNVFMVYNRKEDGSLEELPNKNVDTGMGLERTLAVLNELDDNYKTDLFGPIIENLEKLSGKKYSGNEKFMRIIADHIKAAAFLANEGVVPSNKLQGYIMRRLIRRSVLKMMDLSISPQQAIGALPQLIIDIYPKDYFQKEAFELHIILGEEVDKFQQTLSRGLNEISKYSTITGKTAFDLYQSYGFPLEVTRELTEQKGQKIDEEEFRAELEKHQALSRTTSSGMFRGGLAHHSETTTKYHTATHLLHQTLRAVLGNHVAQKGSNITEERLRFDFSHPEKLTSNQIKSVEDLVNQKIQANLPVTVETMSKDQALKSGALGFFAEKYGDTVTVYSVGNFSKEICGGPHVKNTSELGNFEIIKEESAGTGVRRIYARLS